MTEQAEKRARKGEDNDSPSDGGTVLGPELPKGARIWRISAEARKLFNPDPENTALVPQGDTPDFIAKAGRIAG